jgi:hypothetical protein
MSSSVEIFLILLVVFLVFSLCLIVAGVVAAIVWRKKILQLIYRFLKPDEAAVRRDCERLARRFPELNAEELAAIHIKEEARFLGWIGVFTLIPILGFFVDFSYTAVRQMRMLHVITALYNNDRLDPERLELNYMGIVGGVNLVVRLILIYTASSIPFFSVIINVLLNWFFTTQIGKAGVGINKEQSLWQTARQESEALRERVLVASNTAVGAINYGSLQQLTPPDAASQIEPAALAELYVPAKEQ